MYKEKTIYLGHNVNMYIGRIYGQKMFGNGGTNLHKKGTWDILPAC